MDSALARKTIFAMILVLAVGTRFWGLGWGLPNTYHVDEDKFAGTALRLVVSGDLNPHFFHVPTLHMYALAAMYKVYYWIGRADGTFHSNEQFTYYLSDHPTPFYLMGRTLSALLSVGTILLVFLLGWKMYTFAAGALAAVFLTFSLEHATTSHAMMPDAPMLFFMVLAFYFVWRVYKEGRTRDYLLAGAVAGLAMTTKYGGQMMFLPLFLAHVYHVLESGQPKKKILLHLPLYLSGFVFLAVFLMGTPYALLDARKFVKDFAWQADHLLREGHFGDAAVMPSWLFYLKYGFRDNVGRWVQFLAFGGILAAVVKRRAREIILLSYPIVLLLIIGGWKAQATRYFLPVAPFFILAAAGFADAAARAAARLLKRWAPAARWVPSAAALLPFALGAAAVAPSALQTIRFDRAIARPDTRTLARDWIHFNIPAGSKVALESYGPPISRDIYSTIYRLALGQRSLDALAREDKAEYVVTSEAMSGRFTRDPKNFPAQASFYSDLDREAALIKTFAPAFQYDLDTLISPRLRIYRLSQAPNYRFPGNYSRYAQDVRLVRTGPRSWRLESAIRARGWIEADERVRWPYVRLADARGRELARLTLFEGEAPAAPEFACSGTAETGELPEGTRIFIGYEYRLAPNPLREPPERPYAKEFELPDRIDAGALRDGSFGVSYRYGDFPQSEAGGYDQAVTIIHRGSEDIVWTSVFGGDLKAGAASIDSPFVEFRNEAGASAGTVVLFPGRVGTLEAERPGPIEKRAVLPALPVPCRIVVGNAGARKRGASPAPPFSIELLPLLPPR